MNANVKVKSERLKQCRQREAQTCEISFVLLCTGNSQQ